MKKQIKNKIVIFCVSLLFFVSANANAQHWIGVRSAYNISDISFEPTQKDLKTYSSVNFGLIYRNYIDKYSGLQVEMNFMQSGFTLNDTTRITSSFDVPILGHLRYDTGNFSFFFNAGPYFGYATKVEKKVKSTGVKLDYEFEDRDNRFEYGIGGGIGVAWRFMSKMELQIEGRYNYGLSYIFQPMYEDYKVVYARPSNYQVSVGLLYRFTKAKDYKKKKAAAAAATNAKK